MCGGCYHKLAEDRISLANTTQKGFLPMKRMIVPSVPTVCKYCNKLTHDVFLISKILSKSGIILPLTVKAHRIYLDKENYLVKGLAQMSVGDVKSFIGEVEEPKFRYDFCFTVCRQILLF